MIFDDFSGYFQDNLEDSREFLRILRDFCRFLWIFEDFSRILGDFSGFLINFRDFSGFLMIFREFLTILGYHFMIFRDIFGIFQDNFENS